MWGTASSRPASASPRVTPTRFRRRLGSSISSHKGLPLGLALILAANAVALALPLSFPGLVNVAMALVAILLVAAWGCVAICRRSRRAFVKTSDLLNDARWTNFLAAICFIGTLGWTGSLLVHNDLSSATMGFMLSFGMLLFLHGLIFHPLAAAGSAAMLALAGLFHMRPWPELAALPGKMILAAPCLMALLAIALHWRRHKQMASTRQRAREGYLGHGLRSDMPPVGDETSAILRPVWPGQLAHQLRQLRGRAVSIGERPEQKAQQDEVESFAHYDLLTGLPHRLAFQDQFDLILSSPGFHAALLYIDLDGFRLINDLRGNGIGNKILAAMAGRLAQACLDPLMTVSRLGSDEFAVVLPGFDARSATIFARHLQDRLKAPILVAQERIVMTASIGVALAPEHGLQGDKLLARAGIALAAAKARGKGQLCLFAPNMEQRLHERAMIEARLRFVLESQDGFFVFYQPIMAFGREEPVAREALARWFHREAGWIPPSRFIEIAEQSGLIAALSDLMISKACKDATNWTDGACLAVNISASLLGRGYLPDRIARALLESGLPAARLELEITETALLDDNERVLEELRTIQKMGVSIALDDFGTGYSSLSHLRAFPFQKIKIDGSFVRDAALNPNCAAIVHAIADLGKRLGVATVAEGVETLEQLEFVRSQGCQQVQGNFYSAPLPREEDLPRIRALSNYDVSRGTLAASDRPDDFEPWHEPSSRP